GPGSGRVCAGLRDDPPPDFGGNEAALAGRQSPEPPMLVALCFLSDCGGEASAVAHRRCERWLGATPDNLYTVWANHTCSECVLFVDLMVNVSGLRSLSRVRQ